jgi:multidrug efflux pump subunit AcrB
LRPAILNAGGASTLDIIAGVKARLPRIEAGLTAGLDLHTVGDQSPFVRAAVTGVVREGAIAAALTGLMILLSSEAGAQPSSSYFDPERGSRI